MVRPRRYNDEEVLETLRTWIATRGTPPTVEELRRELGVGSSRTALTYLRNLEDSGRIQRWSGARGMRILAPAVKTSTKMVPVVGQVSAGSLTLAEENIDAWVRLPEQLLKPVDQKFFLLRVHGDSMNRAHVNGNLIEPGDLLLVRQELEAKTGDIIVAEVDGETTVKRLQLGEDFAVLKPESENLEHKLLVFVDEGFHVQGVVVRCFKQASEFMDRVDY
jgi:repressor LexA